MKTAILLLLCVLASAAAQSMVLTGTGGFTMAKVVDGWTFAYQLLRPQAFFLSLLRFFTPPYAKIVEIRVDRIHFWRSHQ